MMEYSAACVLLVVFLCCLVDHSIAVGGIKSEIKLKDNGYTGIVIAIDEDVTEDEATIKKIKEMFTDSSAELYAATKRRAYFKDITILVPKSWTETYDAATSETFDNANIVVNTDDSRGNDPYVKVPNPVCGAPGETMYITEAYVTGNAGDTTYIYSPPARTIVHEWAHLRWGVYDEYPVDADPSFYLDGAGNWQPVRCSSTMTGSVGQTLEVNLDGTYKVIESDCPIDPTTSLPEAWQCWFAPDLEDGQVAEASLMDYQFIADVPHFCDNDEANPDRLHNGEATNRQNKICAKSVWEVMREHVDFADGANPMPEGDIETVTTFKVVQHQAKKVVLVLDVSGSMKGHKLERLRQDVAMYLGQVISNGSTVGMVEFSDVDDTARLHEMQTISSSADRDSLIAAVPEKALSWTCIGCGLLEAIDMLQESATECGGNIILISDGEENKEPYIADVTQDLIDACIRVDVLLYTAAAEDAMIGLAEDTGGASYFASGNETSADLLTALLAMGAEGNSPIADVAIQVTVLGVDIPADSEPTTVTIPIDSTIGTSTRFSITHIEGDTLVVSLESPDGTTYSVDTSECTYSSDLFLTTCDIPSVAEVGEWTLTLHGTHGEPFDRDIYDGDEISEHVAQVLVTSHPASDDVDAITVSATVSNQEATPANDFGLKIIAEVTQGYLPVKGADVTAHVSSGGEIVDVILLDNGAGCDLATGDGLYCAFFVDFVDGDGRYSVSVTVSNDGGNMATVEEFPDGGSPAYLPERALAQSKGLAPKLTAFQGPLSRVTSGGFFEASGLPENRNDLFAPARVLDLTVTGAKAADKTITLQWTAVGDDMDQGQATAYDLRYCANASTALDDWGSCVVPATITEGSLTPATAGTKETITVKLVDLLEDTTIYFALKVSDDSGKVSPLSNVVSTGVTSKTKYDYYADDDDDDEMSDALLAGLISAGGVVLIALVVLSVFVVYSVLRRQPQPGPDPMFSSKKGLPNMPPMGQAYPGGDMFPPQGYDNPMGMPFPPKQGYGNPMGMPEQGYEVPFPPQQGNANGNPFPPGQKQGYGNRRSGGGPYDNRGSRNAPPQSGYQSGSGRPSYYRP